MKRMFIKMLSVMAAVVLATSCSKDDNSNVAIDDTVTPEPANEVAENSVKTITIKGKVSQASLSKVTVEGKTLKFEIGNDADEFKFNNGKTGDSKVEGSIKFTSADGEYTANFSFTDEEELTSSAGFSTSLNAPTTEMSAAKDNLAAAVKAAHYTIDFTVTKVGDSYKLKSAEASDIVVNIHSAFIQALSDATSKMDGKDISVAAGKYYVVPVGKTMGNGDKTTAAGVIYRLGKPTFTINASGKKVIIAKGNLQYQPSQKAWRIAPYPWSQCFPNNVYLDDPQGLALVAQLYSEENTTEWVDLFGWGMWLDGYGNPTETRYYENGQNVYDPYSPELTTDEPAVFKNNTTTVDGVKWFTLSAAECEYLLNTRGADEGFIRYSKAYVHYTNGLVILPDNWNGTYTFSNHNKSDGNFQSISNNDWATLEKEGAVFLPFAGRRMGYSIDCVKSYGLYWLATKYSNDGGYILRFQSKSVEPQGIGDIGHGYSVRLVRDAE